MDPNDMAPVAGEAEETLQYQLSEPEDSTPAAVEARPNREDWLRQAN